MAKVLTRNRNKDKFDKEGRQKKPNWEYRFEGAKVNGKRKHITKSGFKTQKEALEAGTKALAEYLNSGQVFKPSDISVADFLDKWLELYVNVNLRPNSQSTYKGLVNNHMKPALGHYKLQSLTPATLQEFVNAQKTKGFSKQHVDLILSTFKGALNYAIEPLQLIQSNPMIYVKPPKMEKQPRERVILSKEDWTKIIERFPFSDKFHIPLMIGMNTGLRIGEVFGLTWDDVDFKKGTITVNKQLTRYKPSKQVKAKWCISPPKTKGSNRTVKIGDTLLNALRKELTRQKANKLACGEYYTRYNTRTIIDHVNELIPVYHDEDNVNLICVKDDGSHINFDMFKYCSRVIQKELGIKFEFHALRHTHATWLAESGVNPKNLQKRLGHEKIETTLQTYIHDTRTMEDETVDIFERIVSTI